MEPVSGNYSRSMERLGGDVSRRSRRKRRRRRRRREGKGDTLSTLIRTIEHWDSAASSSEDGSSTSSLEVKENQDEKILEERDVLRLYHPSAFCPGFNRVGQRALKRKRLVDGRDGLFCPNSWTYRRSAWAVTQKNAVVQLNELKPGLMYETVSKTGPLHAPVFSVAVELNGFHFEGQGPTKKQAKMRAAELALQSFIQFPNASQAHAAMGNFSSTAMDFTADKLDLPDGFLTEFDLLYCNSSEKEVFSSVCNHRRALRFGLDVVSSNPRRPVSTSVLGHLSPVALLDELRPGLRYMCQVEEVGGRPMRNYIMMVRVDGRVFEGCGRSKRQSKAQAAAAALQSVCNVSLGPERTLRGLQGGRTKNQLPQFFAESIYQLVKEKHSQLTDACSSSSSVCHKVLAGVVMTRGFDLRSARVVSLATGTKCLDLDDLSDLGCTLTDCHAEVLSRRALVQFLYSQLELQVFSDKPAEGEEQSIFTPSQGGFRLQDAVLFHMYVSSSPCGDARLHSPYETSAAYPSRRFCCHLRVKVNGGEGTLPVNVRRANQRRTSVSPGKPVGSMSCTDKMAKWSVVGLQGALLSHLVEPIYLHSLTVGTLSHSGHLGRVMGRRLAPVKHLPFPYRRQQLLLGCLSSREVRMAGKAPDVSVSWSYGDCSLEEVSSSTGRRKDSGTPSQLCRRSLFARWLRLQKKVNGLMLGTEATAGTYSFSKMSAGRYQKALQQFSSSLQVGRLGTWIRKPLNLGHFSAGLEKTAP